MLSIRENLMETIKGGNPDRFVKQYEFLELIMNTPITRLKPPIGGQIVNEWGNYRTLAGRSNRRVFRSMMKNTFC